VKVPFDICDERERHEVLNNSVAARGTQGGGGEERRSYVRRGIAGRCPAVSQKKEMQE